LWNQSFLAAAPLPVLFAAQEGVTLADCAQMKIFLATIN
jgi:hypothetical protein